MTLAQVSLRVITDCEQVTLRLNQCERVSTGHLGCIFIKVLHQAEFIKFVFVLDAELTSSIVATAEHL